MGCCASSSKVEDVSQITVQHIAQEHNHLENLVEKKTNVPLDDEINTNLTSEIFVLFSLLFYPKELAKSCKVLNESFFLNQLLHRTKRCQYLDRKLLIWRYPAVRFLTLYLFKMSTEM